MGSVRGITIELGFDNKSKLKLRAIAKHVGALANELDAIDNTEIETLNEIVKSIGVLNSKTGNEIGNALCKCSDLARSE